MPTVDMLLDEAGLMIEDLAERTNLPLKRVEAIVFGRWTPSPTERQRVAEAFGVPITDVVFGHMVDPRNVRYRRVGLERDFQRDG
ncbi:MAG: helix-turn-helix domain-containing protein, partial [Planctomycetaceae bacterium]